MSKRHKNKKNGKYANKRSQQSTFLSKATTSVQKAVYKLYTDGSCDNLSANREGGYAYIITDKCGNIIKQFSEGVLGTTNNQMELKAIIEGCKAIPEDNAEVAIFSDSQYALNVLSGRFKASKNLDLIKQHEKNKIRLRLTYNWVRGHNGNTMNELADKMANAETTSMKQQKPLSTTRNGGNYVAFVAMKFNMWESIGCYSWNVKEVPYADDIDGFKAGDNPDYQNTQVIKIDIEHKALIEGVVDVLEKGVKEGDNLSIYFSSSVVYRIFTRRDNKLYEWSDELYDKCMSIISQKHLNVSFKLRGSADARFAVLRKRIVAALNNYNPHNVPRKSSLKNDDIKKTPLPIKDDMFADYFVYVTSVWNYTITGNAFLILDDKNEIVEGNAYLGTKNQPREILSAIYEAFKCIPEVGVNVMVYSDNSYGINILSGKWNPKKNFDLIQNIFDYEKNSHINYEMCNSTCLPMKQTILAANKVVADVVRKGARGTVIVEEEPENVVYEEVQEPLHYDVAFTAVPGGDNLVHCCYAIIESSDHRLKTESFDKEVNSKDLQDGTILQSLMLIILTEAFKDIPDDSVINIYSKACYVPLKQIFDKEDSQAYNSDPYLTLNLKYTKSGEERIVNVRNSDKSRLKYALERKLATLS